MRIGPAHGCAIVGLCIVSGVFGFVACTSDETDSDGEGAKVDAEPLFRALEGDLVKTCGGANGQCHVKGTYNGAPTWLGDPDPYVSAKKYRGILPVTKEVGDSILLTQIDHAGPSLKRNVSLFDRVAEWIAAEVPPPPLPNTGAFSVASGFNNVPLNTVASGFDGARLTFLATDQNGVLTLSAMRLYAPPAAALDVEAPFFVILPRSGKVNADPEANGFKGAVHVDAGKSADFFDGKMILLRWDPTGQLKIVFQKVTATPGRGTASGCTSLDVFTSKAIPAFQTQVDIVDAGGGDASTVVGQGTCLDCHGKEPPQGESPAAAVQAMDLRAIGTDSAAACAQARNWINFEDRASSVLLLNPQGLGNPNHPMKPVAASSPTITGLRAWVDAERP